MEDLGPSRFRNHLREYMSALPSQVHQATVSMSACPALMLSYTSSRVLDVRQVRMEAEADFERRFDDPTDDAWDKLYNVANELQWRISQTSAAKSSAAAARVLARESVGKPSTRELTSMLLEAKARFDLKFEQCIQEARKLDAAGSTAPGKRRQRS